MIRLLKSTSDGGICLETFEDGESTPAYAILSHTWLVNNDEEVTYKDVTKGDGGRDKLGRKKVDFCLQQADYDGIKYCWIDTCCINKKHSQELSEAITAMFRWYSEAAKCYAYLSDVSTADTEEDPTYSRPVWEQQFRQSRWFKRGWTLQELLAPSTVEFFSYERKKLGDRASLQQVIHEVTGIPFRALLQQTPLVDFGVEERMLWARSRKTKRPEDRAYCLLGIFKVTIPPLYNEGEESAFERLREAIEKATVRRQAKLKRPLSPGNESELLQARPLKRPKMVAEPSLSAEETERLLKSLRFIEIEARRFNIEAAHVKTCRWLLQDPQYTDWHDPGKQNEHHGFIWIKGHPGSGKSTLLKFALDNTQKRRDCVLLSFFFNARGAKLEKSVTGAYRTILSQLLEQVPLLKSVFSKLGTRAKVIADDHEWDIGSLQTLLTEAVATLGEISVICFIDALDECDDNEVRDMISFLESLCQQTISCPGRGRVQICFASRHYPHITIRKGIELILDDKPGHEKDIIDYLESSLTIGHSKYAEEVRTKVLEKASGVFIWVMLVTKILNKANDEGGRPLLQQKLAEIPSDIYGLFVDILTRDSKNQERTKLCIQWILFAMEPLSPQQLYYAIGSGFDSMTILHARVEESGILDHLEQYCNNGNLLCDIKELDPLEDEPNFVLNHSKGLAEVTKSKDHPTVQFIHESVRDFFLKKGGFERVWPDCAGNVEGLGHERLKQCCLAYINVDPFLRETTTKKLYQRHSPNICHLNISEDTFSSYLRSLVNTRYPFILPAVRSLIYYAEEAARRRISQSEFLRNTFWISRWRQLQYMLKGIQLPSFDIYAKPLYILMDYDATCLILEYPHDDVNAPVTEVYGDQSKKRSHSYSVTYYALSRSKSTQAMRALIAKGADVNVGGGAPLQSVCCNRFAKGLELLLANSVDVRIGGSTALYTAIASSFPTGVKMLLDAGVDPNEEDKAGESPLLAAVKRGSKYCVKFLLDAGADVDARGAIALQAASWDDRLEIVKMLLGAGANVNAEGGTHGSPLVAAIRGGSKTCVELLLDAGANVHSSSVNALLEEQPSKLDETILNLITQARTGAHDHGVLTDHDVTINH